MLNLNYFLGSIENTRSDLETMINQEFEFAI